MLLLLSGLHVAKRLNWSWLLLRAALACGHQHEGRHLEGGFSSSSREKGSGELNPLYSHHGLLLGVEISVMEWAR
jgi:hypothetical protein